jgi:putative membrane protein
LRAESGASLRSAAALLAGATVLAQIAYPLTGDHHLALLTQITVLLFAGASVLHAAGVRGAVWALALLVLAAGIGFGAELLGVRTGFPFGEYTYTDALQPQLLGVPVVVPLAWVMMAYPCLLLGRRLARAGARRSRRPAPSSLVAVLTGGLALASWDIFLDPQMVDAGFWTWAHPEPGLPGVPGVPLTNYAGWVLVSLVLMAALEALLPHGERGLAEGVPGLLLAWTWAGSTLANAVFFDRPGVAIWGGLLMGVLVVPYLYFWWDGRP